MANKFVHVLVSPRVNKVDHPDKIHTCASLQKALRTLFSFPANRVVCRKGSHDQYIYICYDGELYHFKRVAYYVAMSELELYTYATQIRKVLMPKAEPYSWEV